MANEFAYPLLCLWLLTSPLFVAAELPCSLSFVPGLLSCDALRALRARCSSCLAPLFWHAVTRIAPDLLSRDLLSPDLLSPDLPSTPRVSHHASKMQVSLVM